MRRIITAAGAFLFVLAVTGAAATAEPLKSEAAVNAVLGKVLRSEDGWWAQYNKDGTTRFTKGDFTDTGNWRIDGDGLLCVRWKKIRDGATTCFEVTLDGSSWRYVHATGSTVGAVGSAMVED